MNTTNRSPVVIVPSSLQMPTLERLFYYVVICSGFVGVALFPIKLGIFTLFPFRLFLFALWVLFIIRVLTQRGKFTVPVGTIKSYVLFLGLWTAYAITSLAWAISKTDCIRHIAFLLTGISVIFFTINYLRTLKDLIRLYWIWVGVFFALVFLGIWEHLTGHHLPVSKSSEERLASLPPYAIALLKNVPTGVFNNPNDYATFLTLGVPFILSLIRYGYRRWVCLASIATALVSFYLIIVTGSRANLLAVLMEIAFVVLFLRNLSQKIKVVLVGTFVLGLAFALLPSPIQAIVQKITEQLGSIPVLVETKNDSLSIRLNLARNGLDFLFRTMGFGVGAGNAEYWIANFARYDTYGILNLHNWWLEILVNYGIFIFFGYVAMYLGLLCTLWQRWRMSKDRSERMIAEALLVAVVGFSVASTSSSSIMAFYPQWLLFAFALAFLRSKKG